MSITSDPTQNKVDWDGIFLLFLSILWGIGTLGIAWYVQIWRILRTSKSCFSQPLVANVWIVFGKKLQQDKIDATYRQRLDRVIENTATFSPQLVILQGGVTKRNTISEAKAGKAYLQSQIFNLNFQLILESSSRNTLENLKQTRNYLQTHQRALNVCLISNRYHLHRCAVIAKNLGFNVEFLPAEKHWVLNCQQLSNVLLEAFFLNWYWTGRVVSQLLKNKRMLDKIQ